MQLTITGYSTALFSTWFFVEELGLLLDAGDGVASGLLQKGRKVKNIFISHAHRDHLTGLFQFNQLNARKGFPVIHYPADSGSFPVLKEFTGNFDEKVKKTIWKPIKMNTTTVLEKGIVVDAIRNNHLYAAEGVSRSLSFKIYKEKRKLKAEFSNLSGNEIRDLITLHGNDKVTELVRENLLNYAGDMAVEDYERWDNSNVLIHESTFIGDEIDRKINPHGNKHSTLEEVMKMVSEIKVEQLILNHFSPRYTKAEIKLAVIKTIKKYNIKIPVFIIPPGDIVTDVLKGKPVNA